MRNFLRSRSRSGNASRTSHLLRRIIRMQVVELQREKTLRTLRMKIQIDENSLELLDPKLTIEASTGKRLLIQSFGEQFKPLPSQYECRILFFVELCTTAME